MYSGMYNYFQLYMLIFHWFSYIYTTFMYRCIFNRILMHEFYCYFNISRIYALSKITHLQPSPVSVSRSILISKKNSAVSKITTHIVICQVSICLVTGFCSFQQVCHPSTLPFSLRHPVCTQKDSLR